MLQYLKQVRQMEGYGEVAFPHCLCNSRKGGHVIAIVGATNFKLQACKEDGTLEVSAWRLIQRCFEWLLTPFQSQVIEFLWPDIEQYEIDEEGTSFDFAYKREGKKPRWVKIFTSYVSL
jgi:sorting nexin-27